MKIGSCEILAFTLAMVRYMGPALFMLGSVLVSETYANETIEYAYSTNEDFANMSVCQTENTTSCQTFPLEKAKFVCNDTYNVTQLVNATCGVKTQLGEEKKTCTVFCEMTTPYLSYMDCWDGGNNTVTCICYVYKVKK
ncbi:hypothetical protein M8J76_008046 [Diaphorina citri]|nr:hypothetical protein M8J75_016151 [Diaphorina citri]KAI5722419.1 hypothetical protein M8J76_008046 [Diaphorina citri]KAI5725531.1 hypothetical protein M8J77_016669 [Diaphorina citri]